jgi:hypothetical protein
MTLACLPKDRMTKHFIVASEYLTALELELQHLCVKIANFVKLHFI